MENRIKNLISIIFVSQLFVSFSAYSYTHSEIIKIGKFTTSANTNGIIWLTKKDGTNFSGCNNPIVWQASPSLDPAVPPFTPTDKGLDSTMGTVLIAKGMDLDVTVYYHIATDGTCRYEIITVE